MSVVAPIGFDERHVIRSILRMGFRNVANVILLRPAGDIDKRSIKAVNEIEKIATEAGASLKLVEVPVENVAESISKIRELIIDELKTGNSVLISLGGGLRALVIETLIASLLIPPELKDYVRVIADLETGKGSIEFAPDIIDIPRRLTRVELRILETLHTSREMTVAELTKKLGISKSTVWKTVKRLFEQGLLDRINGRVPRYKLARKGLIAYKIHLSSS